MLNKYTNFLRNYPIDLFLLVDIITTNIAEKYQKNLLCVKMILFIKKIYY